MFTLNIWGSRGSVSVSGPAFVRHGGATTCVELTSGREHLVIDCGTGLADLGRQWGGRGDSMTLLQSHFHWDHLQGFPFFLPFYRPTFSARLLAVSREGTDFRKSLEAQMCPPRFPVGLEVLGGDLQFETLPQEGVRRSRVGTPADSLRVSSVPSSARKIRSRAQGRGVACFEPPLCREASEIRLGAFAVQWAEMQHPSGSTAFRVSTASHSVVVSGDVEVGLGCEDRLVELCQGADVLVMDSQYFPEDYSTKRGFGHSTYEDAVRVAHRAGVRELVLTHHDPSHDDLRLDSKLTRARAMARALGGGLQVSNAFDGFQVELGFEAPASSLGF